MSSLVDRADAFAFGALASIGQTRKYTGERYVNHVRAVAVIVESVLSDEAMVAAALLHDVVEDTHVRLADIRDMFGHDVVTLVDWLTNPPMPVHGGREARFAVKRRHLARAPARAQTIKVADMIDNTETIVDRDPAFAVVYLREAAALLDVLTQADPALVARARAQIGGGA